MSAGLIIFYMITAIIIFFITLEVYNHLKLKRKVQEQWGKPPQFTRIDKEESLKKAWILTENIRPKKSIIDDLTWSDLDMMQVFEKINATYSSVGSERLYQKLRSYDFVKDGDWEKLIAYYEQHPSEREKIQLAFAQLGKKDHNSARDYLVNSQKRELSHLWLYCLLGLLPAISMLLLIIGIQPAIFLLVGSFMFNILYYQLKKIQLETELNAMSYLVQTISCGKKIVKYQTPYQIQLQKALAPLAQVAKVGFSFRVSSGSEAEILWDYLNAAFMLPFISYHFVLKKLASQQDAALDLWDFLGDLEAAAAVLNFRTYLPLWSEPEFTSNKEVKAEELYHPLLAKPVVNPVDWQKNTLVTGSNASGKSTYVKAIAINLILAQTINTVLAASLRTDFGHVLTSMAVEDDVIAGDSYFIAEINSLKRLLDKVQTNERCYCFVDEILKGTNTVERIAASSSIIHWLRDYPALAFVATHDIELTEILKEEVDNIHFEEQVSADEGIIFDYQLHQGPAKSRNALALLSVLDYPSGIITDAQRQAKYFDEYHKWQKV